MKKIWNTSRLYSVLSVFGIFLLLLSACKKDKTEAIKEPLKITDYYPNSGNQGTLVTVEGTGFGSSISEVSASFSGAPADVVSVTPTEVVLRSPKNGTTGDISLKVSGEQVNIGKYTYQELSVQKISPSSGSAGTHVQITGSGFSSLTGPPQVFVNGKPAVIVSANDNLIVAEVPVAAGIGPITVKVNGKEAAGQTFKFQSVTGIKPLSGGKGTRVKISGSGFAELAAGNYVDFNGKQALVEAVAEDHLTVIAPDGVATGPVTVTIEGQKITGPVFTVVVPPLITNVTPLSGPKGAVMTITGTTFSTFADENKVTINGVVVPTTSATATELKLTLPGGTGSGKIIVNVNDQIAQGPDFKDQNLGISKLSPESGLAGTKVTITGTAFSAVASQNIVTFNGTPAVVSSATETTLVVTAPVGFTSGPLKVTVNGIVAVAPADFNHAGVATLAGGPGKTDIRLSNYKTSSLVVDSKGNVFVLEVDYHTIKKIAVDGTVSLFAGSASGSSGSSDGQGTAASFSFGMNPGMEIDKNDNLYVSDAKGVRKVTPQGMVSTFAPNLGTVTKMAFDENGMLYVMRGMYDGAWKLDKNGDRSAVSVSTLADQSRPVVNNGIIYKINNEVIFIDEYTIATNRSVYRWVGANYGFADGIGSDAMFSGMNGMVTDRAGNLYITDGINHAIRKVEISTKKVTTLVTFGDGYADGPLNNVKSGFGGDIALDKDGNIYFIDMRNNAIRKIFLK